MNMAILQYRPVDMPYQSSKRSFVHFWSNILPVPYIGEVYLLGIVRWI